MTRAAISSADRLGLTLFIAATLHAVTILGVTFSLEKPQKQAPPERTIEIMVIQNPKKSPPPQQADFLAQRSQQGGGEESERVRTTTQPPQPAPRAQPAPQPSPPQPPQPPRQPETSTPKRVLTQQRPSTKQAPPPEKRREKAPPAPQFTLEGLMTSANQEIERLSAELDQKTRAYAKRPKRKTISASTQEYKYASYLDAWRHKVEHIGNLNYPDEAKRRRLYGNLLLHVALNTDGTIREINIKRSSGHKLLDDAAIRIVRLAAPYAPFPTEIREEVQVLDIIRTWQFKSNNQLFSQ
ncbi:MAG: energy transducer TonB [gamma proteobacterium symbiont of Phacoides pectinatus]